jgi:hypothetical protein
MRLCLKCCRSFSTAAMGTLLAATSLALQAGQATSDRSRVKIVMRPGMEIGAEVNKAVAALPKEGGTIELPAGSFVQRTPISVSGTGVHIVGDVAGTALNYDPAKYHIIDSADSTEGWNGTGVKFGVQRSIGEDRPDPIQGEAYIEAATKRGGERRISKVISRTNCRSGAKIGVWMTVNLTMGPPHECDFYISDGSHVAYWKLTPLFFYGQWKFFELDPAHPSGEDAELDMNAISLIGFRHLLPNAKYYFGPVSLYTPAGLSIAFSSCRQCSLENVSIHWEPASTSDSIVEVGQNTRELLLTNVSTVGGANGFSFDGNSFENTCLACTAERAAANGFYLHDTTSNHLANLQASHNANGMVLATGANHNIISSARFVGDNGSALVIDGSDNQITNADLETWMSMGLVIRGGTHNSITGLVARSPFGESAVQFLGDAAFNTLTSISIMQSGANGLDLGSGGSGWPHDNSIVSLTVHNSGSSSWHGGHGASSEGRGLCICGTDKNSFSHVQIYDAGQESSSVGVEGIIIAGSSHNQLDDVLVQHAKHEGITIWSSSDNQLRRVRLVRNGQTDHRAGLRIDSSSRNTVLENICYLGNGGGAAQDFSGSSIVRGATDSGTAPNVHCE